MMVTRVMIKPVSYLWDVWNTVQEMMRDREYTPQAMTKEEFIDKIKEKENILNHKYDDLEVMWEGSVNAGVDVIRNVDSRMTTDHAILIVHGGITDASKKSIRELRMANRYIEVFTYEELKNNPTKHYLVPLHRLPFLICYRGSYPGSAYTIRCQPFRLSL